MAHSSPCALSFLYSAPAYYYTERLNIWHLSQPQLNTNYQPEVAEEMHHCLRTDELLVVGHRTGRNRDHMGCSLEDSGGGGPQLAAEKREGVVGLMVWCSASPQQLGSQVELEMLSTRPEGRHPATEQI